MLPLHYSDVILSALAFQITGVAIVCSTACSGRSKKTSKPRVTGLCAGNSPVTGEFPAQKASNAENVSIWWRHHFPLQGRKSPEYQNFSSANSKRTLRGECFKEKRFIKQNELELRQRHEHGEMFRDFERSREEEMRNLEDDLRRQMDKAVKEVIRNMDQGMSL